MTPKVYISASNRWAALFFADAISKSMMGLVSSLWHDEPMTRTREIADERKEQMAHEARERIQNSEVLLLIADPDMVPGGKFVDAGIALGAGRTVILVGRRENLKMFDPAVIQVDDHWGVLKVLRDQFAVQPSVE